MMKKMAAFTAAVALSAGALTAQAADVTLKMHTFLPPQALHYRSFCRLD